MKNFDEVLKYIKHKEMNDCEKIIADIAQETMKTNEKYIHVGMANIIALVEVLVEKDYSAKEIVKIIGAMKLSDEGILYKEKHKNWLKDNYK